MKVNLTKKHTLFLFLLHILVISGCIYTMDIQQGNLLDQEAIDQIQISMTRSQVKFLLGTPIVQDSFHQNRWDYLYYLKLGNSNALDKRWLTIYFLDDLVSRIDKELEINPSL